MRRFIVREANLFEYDDIRTFYKNNADEHVMLRSEDIVKAAISDGVFFIALDTEKEDSSRIFAASAVYGVQAKDGTGKTIFLKEAGGSLVKKEYRGLSVHKIFHCARALHEFILDRGGFSEYFGAIICPNDPSVANIEQAAFKSWPDPPPSLVAERTPYAKEGQEIRFFRFPKEALKKAAAALLNYANRGKLSRDINGDHEECQLVLDLQLLKRYRPILEELAKGNFKVLDN